MKISKNTPITVIYMKPISVYHYIPCLMHKTYGWLSTKDAANYDVQMWFFGKHEDMLNFISNED